ncbi:pyrroline-5-carboxylate reductase [Chelatococcus reniformis]|uniref:Pyrroline-5-carboxylate reductase n=1 Tax=Chelatococcus reniformis TaxID=1494448 RepID=A0A916XK69_9HYPH|nr:pyrroline-5-carboxylate reductase [Chelatococcus reniformis]GGC80338.1 pyrroline-5-carboxylate reductase [Chelatococcus reniformis]
MQPLPSPLVLVGAGRMGGAMLNGWLEGGLAADATCVLEPHATEELRALCAARGIRLNPPVTTLPAPAALVLAIKPQMLADVAPELGGLVRAETLVVSILAGKRLDDLGSALPGARAVVRAMPNLAASIRRGITVAIANAAVTPAQRAAADGLLAAVGAVEWVEDEGLIDAVTAVSGSGPAYVFHLAEALAQAGRAAGLPQALADRLARETVVGAGELLARSAQDPAALREAVTSPGGTTAAALAVLMGANGLTPLLSDAVAAAARRSRELSG